MNKYTRIESGAVAELLEVEGDITEMFHPDLVWVDVTGQEVFEKWVAVSDKGKWTFSPDVPAPMTTFELKAAASLKRDELMLTANEKTLGMSDAYIAGLLNEADTSMFKAFAAYKLALSKIDIQPGYPLTIEWPLSPPALSELVDVGVDPQPLPQTLARKVAGFLNLR
ncbi:tail fiber assembly protein [Pseudomonas purpurea]|uniref:tail fiber assembly protein n=1 Tax=Pseudomonas purpurea TaxID=3136737 RepID=UPI00326300F1